MNIEEILVAVSNNAISKKTYIIHSNIREFVDMAMEDVEDFFSLTMMEKKDIISAIADAWILESRPRNILDDMTGQEPNNVSVSI